MRLPQSLVFTLAAPGLFIATFLATSCFGPMVAETSHLESRQLFDLLDTGQDGSLSPFEALDALLVIAEDGDLTRDTLGAFLDEYAADEYAESRDFFDMEDSDHDGNLVLNEFPDGFASMMSSLDIDSDDAISWSEFQLADIATSELMAKCE